ncbi:MAG: NfeD family protein [Mollicutes bacterium]|nr:NfeD family protein [Mollicutes bacterium]
MLINSIIMSGDYMIYIWLAIIILLTIVELMTVELTTIWFVISAIVSLILSFFVDSFVIQCAVFIILGIILLITTRPILLKLIAKYRRKKNIENLIGMRAYVVSPISPNNLGEVKVNGQNWLAHADETIDMDTYVTVIEINDHKLKVSKDG